MKEEKLTGMKMYEMKFEENEDVVNADGAKMLVLSAFEFLLLREMGGHGYSMSFEIHNTLRQIDISFDTTMIDNYELEFLAGINSAIYSEPGDGHPRFEVEIRAKDNEEDNLSSHKWMESSDKYAEDYEEIKKYKYDGTFEVRITIEFSKNDWAKYAEVKKE